jgi:hypothetical protein
MAPEKLARPTVLSTVGEEGPHSIPWHVGSKVKAFNYEAKKLIMIFAKREDCTEVEAILLDAGVC